MHVHTFLLMALGQSPGGSQQNPTAQMLTTLSMMAFFIFVMYFIMIRPQQKKAREHAALLQTIKPGDKVVTSGGILGTVVSVKEKSIALRSADTKLEVLKSAVSEVVERSSNGS